MLIMCCWCCHIILRRPPSVSQDYGFAPGVIEKHLWWLKRPILNDSFYHIFHIWKLCQVVLLCPWLFWYFSSLLVACSCIHCLLDSLFYEMPSRGAIFDHKLATFFVNGCILQIPLANIIEAKEWAASFTCTLFKLSVQKVSWNPSFSHPEYVTQPSKASLSE